MTALQPLLDFIDTLKRLEAVYTLETWLVEHALFTLVLFLAVTIWAMMTIDDISKPKPWKDDGWRKRSK